MRRTGGRRKLLPAVLLCVVLLAACSTPPSPPPLPTDTLIAATPTDTPTVIPPTPTPPSLPGPDDLRTPHATPVPQAMGDAPLVETDPIAAGLVGVAQRLIAEQLNLPVRRVQLVEVAAYTWDDTSLGCPVPDVTYEPMEIDGYRIRLRSGDQEFLFHTDFDRVVPCDPVNERLPVEATAEPTSEATEAA